MNLGSALTTASSGLESITRRLALISQNVANAGTPGYVRQTIAVSSATAGGEGMGVRTGVATRNLDEQLQADVFTANATTAASDVRTAALAGIDATSGMPGSGRDLPGLLGALRDGFSALSADPASGSQQLKVIQQAKSLAAGLNELGHAVSQARQNAQDTLVSDTTTANTALQTLGKLSDEVIKATARGESTADLENQRDAQMHTISELTGAQFLRQPNGDMLAVSSGAVLPLRASTGPFTISDATLAPDTPAVAVPRLELAGTDVTGRGLGGRIGANLALRDQELSGLQAGLDGFTQALASGFQRQGVTLFTNAAGVVPAAGTAGFAQTVQVASAVVATPTMVRDGAAPAGSAGNTALIDSVLSSVLGTGAGTLAARATSLTAGHASLAADAAARADTNKAVQTTLEAKLAAGTGVSVDTEMAEMVTLQNAYGANAKVIAASQAMWTQLLDSVR